MSKYLVVEVNVHHRTSGHTQGYFQDTLDEHKGWKLHSVVPVSELKWLLILEK